MQGFDVEKKRNGAHFLTAASRKRCHGDVFHSSFRYECLSDVIRHGRPAAIKCNSIPGDIIVCWQHAYPENDICNHLISSLMRQALRPMSKLSNNALENAALIQSRSCCLPAYLTKTHSFPRIHHLKSNDRNF